MNDPRPTPIRYRGDTYWLLATNHRYHTLQHAESGDLLNIFAQSDVADYRAIAHQIAIENIHHAIRRERAYQDRKYGTISERKLPLDDYIAILWTELGEATRSFIERDYNNARCELLQVAAVAVAALEAHGIIERPENKSPNPPIS